MSPAILHRVITRPRGGTRGCTQILQGRRLPLHCVLPAPKGCTAHLIGLIGHYPELKSDSSFMKLHENLVKTEQRIALARGYGNSGRNFP